jgi:hypothetical protein
MTLTALVVLTAALAGSAGTLAARAAAARTPQPAFARSLDAPPVIATRDTKAAVSCTLRIVHAPRKLDAAIVRRPGKRGSDAIVRDSLSPCAP